MNWPPTSKRVAGICEDAEEAVFPRKAESHPPSFAFMIARERLCLLHLVLTDRKAQHSGRTFNSPPPLRSVDCHSDFLEAEYQEPGRSGIRVPLTADRGRREGQHAENQ